MDKVLRTAVTAAAIAIAALSLTLPAQAGPRSAVGAGLVGFGIGAILGSMMGPPEVYFVPPPPRYYGPVVYGPPHYDGPVPTGPLTLPAEELRALKLLPASELWMAATGA